MKLSPRKTLLLLAAVCSLPVVASYFTFYVIQPGKRMNYGELVQPKSLPGESLAGLDGRAFDIGELRGRWVMLTVDASVCDQACRHKLYTMRQVRTAQGKEMARVERLWLLTDGGTPTADLLNEYDGTVVARSNTTLVKALPAKASATDYVWLLDPLGNVMMRYPKDPDAKRMVKDFERLLKYSRIG